MSKPPRRKYTGICPGNLMCDARSSRLCWWQVAETGIGRDYTEGQKEVPSLGLVLCQQGKWNHIPAISHCFDCNDSTRFL